MPVNLASFSAFRAKVTAVEVLVIATRPAREELELAMMILAVRYALVEVRNDHLLAMSALLLVKVLDFNLILD